MAKTYRVTPLLGLVNRVMAFMVRLGIGPKQTHILSVRGRKSGKLYSTPVSLVSEGEKRWLVAPYGEVGWVRNARAAGQVTLTQGRRRETVSIVEVEPQARAPILKQYVQLESFPRPYFDAGPDAPVEAFAAEASRHPVFLIQTAAQAHLQ